MAETVIIKVTATDSQGGTGEARATITVNAPDPPESLAPEITSLSADDITLNPGQITKIEVVGIRYDRVVWTHSGGTLEQDPDTTDVENQQFTAPSNVVAGTEYTVTVVLANDHGTDTATLTLTINNVAPIISDLSGIPQAPASVLVGGSFTAVATASDPNGDNIAFSWASPGFTQNVGMAPNQRDFTAPSSFASVADARKVITCTASDIPPAPHPSLSDSRQQAVIISPTQPDAPIIDRVNVTQSTLEVEWREPSNTGGGPVTGYRIQLRIDDSTNFTRTAVVGPTVRSFTYDNLAADTPHEVSVQTLNTFDISDNTYGFVSDRARRQARTDAMVVIPEPPPGEDNDPPNLRALPDDDATRILVNVTQIIADQVPIIVPMRVAYFDPNNDEVTITWRLSGGDLQGTLGIDPQPGAFMGEASADYTIPAGHIGDRRVICVATDEHGLVTTLTFSIAARYVT